MQVVRRTVCSRLYLSGGGRITVDSIFVRYMWLQSISSANKPLKFDAATPRGLTQALVGKIAVTITHRNILRNSHILYDFNFIARETYL